MDTREQWFKDDGGRSAAGFSRGDAGDCVTRAIAIAADKPYAEVYDAINSQTKGMRQTKRVRGSNARTGVNKAVYERYLAALGWKWTPTMQIGSGCTTHLRRDELPSGRLIVRLSGHLAAVIDGVLHDTYDCSRDGSRCVYGYWQSTN